MSNETKRDVFNDLLEELADAYIALDGEGIGEELTNEDKQVYLKDYDTALPDDMPVIPEAVGDVIVKFKHKKFSLSMSYAAVVSISSWMTLKHEEDFTRAWLTGVWRVEETGEIVKLEAEKEINNQEEEVTDDEV